MRCRCCRFFVCFFFFLVALAFPCILGLFSASVGSGLWVFSWVLGLWVFCLGGLFGVCCFVVGFVGLGCFRVFVWEFFGGFFCFLGIGFLVGFAWVGVEAIVSCIFHVY
jgi:hypothetical protein